jgi:hypothetical protein
VDKGRLSIQGNSTSQSTNYGVSLDNASSLTVNAGPDLTGGNAVSITGNNTALGKEGAAQGVLLSGSITNNSLGGATAITSENSGIYLDTTANMTNASKAGAITVKAGNGTTTGKARIQAANVAVGGVAQITQHANANVIMSTDGLGNLVPAKIVNNGTGNVYLVAGGQFSQGTGLAANTAAVDAGGQVRTATNNTITNNQTNVANGQGMLYVYTGGVATTGALSNLNAGFNNLFYNGTSNAINTGFSRDYGTNNTLSAGSGQTVSATQVLFRDSTKPAFTNVSLTKADLVKEYNGLGTNNSDFKAALKAVAGNAGNATVVSGNQTFALAKSDIIDALALDSTSSAYKNVYRDPNNYNTILSYGLGVDKTGVSALNVDAGTLNPGSSTLKITPKAITVSGIKAIDKVYDANTSATVNTANAAGWIVGDTVTVSATGTFGSKNVGTNKTVTLSGAQYGGADAGNYSFTDQATTTANITQKAITVSGITAGDKVYDANTSAIVNTANAAGWIVGDTVTVSATGTFSDKNAGNGKTVTLSNTQYGGADAGNYRFTDQATTMANISKNKTANVELTAKSGSKTYNGTNQSITGLASASGLVGEDTVDNIGVTASTSGKNVGTYRNTEFGNLTTLENNYQNITKNNGTLVIAENTTSKNANSTTDPLLNPVPVNPNYKSPDKATQTENLVTTEHSNDQIQKQCSLDFAKECKVQPTTVQNNGPRYTTFY